MTKSLSRRTFLRGAGFTLALPMLEAMEARAATLDPTRLVIFFTPDGFYRPTFDPTGTETAFNLPRTLAPLNPFKSKMLFLDNIDQTASMASSYGNNGHDRGMAGVLTGTKTSAKRLASGASIDDIIARRIGAPPGGFQSLVLGAQTANTVGFSRICFTGTDAAVAPQENPQTTFNRIVGATSADPAIVKRRLQRKKVIDFVLDDYRSLRSTLGAADKLRLESHVTAVEALQTELGQVASSSCTIPTIDFSNLTYPKQVKLQTDLAVLAMKCDLTRVIVIQCSKSVSRVVPDWLNFNGSPISKEHHDLAHYGDGANDAAMLQIVDEWYGQQFAYLCAQMNGVTESNGTTLLDNSLAVWTTEYGNGINHNMGRTPFIFVGSGGGKIRTASSGRFIKFAAGTNHNKVLVTMDRVMGGTTNVIGDASFPQGVLPNVLV